MARPQVSKRGENGGTLTAQQPQVMGRAAIALSVSNVVGSPWCCPASLHRWIRFLIGSQCISAAAIFDWIIGLRGECVLNSFADFTVAPQANK